MVLDNADDRDIWLGPVQRSRQVDTPSIPLIDYLPRCNEGHLLVTTRDRQLGHKLGESRHQPLVVPRLGPREARVLLSTKLPGEETLDPADADELTKALEYLPLTITQGKSSSPHVLEPLARFHLDIGCSITTNVEYACYKGQIWRSAFSTTPNLVLYRYLMPILSLRSQCRTNSVRTSLCALLTARPH